MPRASDPELPSRLRDRALIEAGLRDGVQAALLRHKQAGVPIAVWENGKVVLVAPEHIRVKAPGPSSSEAAS